jgi:hypothetical protein
MVYKDPFNKVAYDAAYQAEHKEEIVAYKKEYYINNIEKIRAKRKVYNDSHKKQISDHGKMYYVEHKNEMYDKHKSYNTTHVDENREYQKKYYSEHIDEITNYKKEYQKRDTHESICVQCGENFLVSKYTTGKFCSDDCAHKWYSGPNNASWRGGISIEYCPKFNDTLRENIRVEFGRRCFLSGIKENGRKLDVHHCDYLKSQGCSGQNWSLLPLSKGWHTKTGTKRWYWFALLRDYWIYKYLTFHGMDIFEGPDRTTWLWEIYNNEN